MPGFLKPDPGQYGEGDKFLGVTVPQTRSVLRECDLPLAEQLKLLKSPLHELRLLALLHLSRSFKEWKPETTEADLRCLSGKRRLRQ